MPTLSSRPKAEDTSLTEDDVVEIIQDAISFSGPSTINKFRIAIQTICRTLCNVGILDDFYISHAGGGSFDVGFKMTNDLHFNIIKIN